MIYYFSKDHFLFLNNKKAYFVGLDLNIYEIDYKILERFNYKVDWNLANEFYKLRYKSLEDYISKNKDFVNFFKDKWKNKKLVVGFTGGKDSVVLSLILEKLGLNFVTVYSHIPYISELLYFLSREIYDYFETKIIEINKEEVIPILKKPLYVKCPLRGLKMKYLRIFLKKNNLSRNNLVTGERVYESPKRYEKLKNKFHNPIQYMSDLDVFYIAIKNNLLSKIYYINPRASCVPCPRASTLFWYLGLLNLELFEPKGFEYLYEGLIKDYQNKLNYLNGISKEQFVYLGLHRIHPNKIKDEVEFLSKLMEYGKKVSRNKIYRILKDFINYYKKIK